MAQSVYIRAKEIMQIMAEKRMTQCALSEASGISRATINITLRRGCCSMVTAARIANVLGVTYKWVTGEESGMHELVSDAAASPNGYQQEALRTAGGMCGKYPMWLNGALGLNGEAGEVADMVKKHLFQGHSLDLEHLAKELGDCAWYLAVTAHAIGYDLETILRMNVDKLRRRYPNGFEVERSLHRQEGDV